MPTAMKRKLDVLEAEEEDEAQLTSVDARRSILDISMLKLRSAPPSAPLHRKVEPSLRRSVLIFNTLKHLEAQLKREGVCVPPPPPGQAQHELLPVIEDNSDVVMESAPATALPLPPPPPCACLHGSNGMVLVAEEGQNAAPLVTTTQTDATSTYVKSHDCQCSAKPDVRLQDAVLLNPTAPNVLGSPGQVPVSNISAPPSCYSGSTHLQNTNHVPLGNSQYHAMSTAQSTYTCVYNQKSSYSCSLSMSVTESLFSDTSKMLDTLMTNDKLVNTATNFSSLFELENQGSTSSPSDSVSSFSNAWGPAVPVGNTALPVISSGEEVWGGPLAATVVTSDSMSTEDSVSSEQWAATTSTYQELRSPSPAAVQSLSTGFSPPATPHAAGATLLTPSTLASCPAAVLPPSIAAAPSMPSVTLPAATSTAAAVTTLNALPASACPERSSPLTCRQECDAVVSAAAFCSHFGDIDCNMFDFDMFMPSLSPNIRLTPLNPDDLLHSLPSTDSPTFGSPTWSPKSEHIADDLDHIMQILVGL